MMASEVTSRKGGSHEPDTVVEDETLSYEEWSELAQVLVEAELLTVEDLDDPNPFQYLGNYCLHDALAYGRIRSAGELRVILDRKFTMPCCGTIGITVADLVRYGQCPIEGCPSPMDAYYSFCHEDFVDGNFMTHCYRCHTCYDWHYWHCLECDRCTYYAYDETQPKCEWCGSMGELPPDVEGPGQPAGQTSGELLDSAFPAVYVPAMHFAAFTLLVFIFTWQLRIPLTHPFTFGRHLVFFTNWALLLSVAYFIVAMATDLYPLNKRLRGVRDRMFLLVTVANVVVAIMYWGLYSLDPQTLVPADGRYPFPLMVLAHGGPAVLMLIDMVLTRHSTLSVARVLYDQAMLAISYLSWSFLSFRQNGIWPYPFQASFGLQEHILFDSGALVLLFIAGIGVRQLNASLSGTA